MVFLKVHAFLAILSLTSVLGKNHNGCPKEASFILVGDSTTFNSTTPNCEYSSFLNPPDDQYQLT
jgi:hypothetical protein